MLFNDFESLGFNNPFYIKSKEGSFVLSKEFNYLLSKQKKVLDFTGLIEVFIYGYCLGDRTLVKNISRSPWMAKPNSDNTKWVYSNKIKFDNQNYSHGVIAEKFFALLKKELLTYISNHKIIGLLLTGGMDSRIVACVLRNIEKEGLLEGKKIKTFTWGYQDSRDVVYAKKIAKLYNWSWEHTLVDTEQMRVNIETTINSGCEYSPIHLHAMTKLANRKDIDCYIAGSFGDSIGRGEFSGKHLLELKSMKKKISNQYGLLRDDFGKLIEKDIADDLNYFRINYNQKEKYQNYEIDLQGHYMRRMLNPCMSIINNKIPLFQMFSSLEVFSFMWQLSPELRNDKNYEFILKKFAPELLEIPWARTGLKYPFKEGNPDGLKKNHHDYGKMIREDFLDQFILRTVKNNEVLAKKIINLKAFYNLCKNVKKRPINNQWKIESNLLYIACVIEMINRNGIDVLYLKNHQKNYLNIIVENCKYNIKAILKKYM